MAEKEMYSARCRDAGMSCDFEVCDSNEDEVLSALQDHARRAHGKEVSTEEVRPIVKSGEMACH